MPSRTSEPSAPSAKESHAGSASGYIWGISTVVLTTAFSYLVARYLQLSELVMINLLGVVAISTRFEIGPSLLTATLTSLSFDFFFIPPVFAFAPSDLKSGITLGTMTVVAGIISGLGERSRRQRAAARALDLQIETERLRSSLLSAVSHDLKTPLAAILGAGTELIVDDERLDREERLALARAIVEESERLDQLVTNLLDVARLEGGAVALRKRSEAIEEVVEAALGRMGGRLAEHPIKTSITVGVPMVPMDPMLIRQVFVNLFENVLRYTPLGSPIEIDARLAGRFVEVRVSDRGPGIPGEEPARLFERFHRGSASGRRDGGMGLGLTICRAIVEAHGGSISIANRDEGGAIVHFTLPLTPEKRPGAPS
ncbi:MAG TPA: ATP-binding protein [Polyangiaceae bacterium]|jgi:two-component system sensor histidine kinase KdpD|nr:ATP-binding protein [Polyangiaceae bacterium]